MRVLPVLVVVVLAAACSSSPATSAPPGTRVPGAAPQPDGASFAAPSAGSAAGVLNLVPLPNFPTAAAFEVTGVVYAGDSFVATGFGGYQGEDYFGRRQGLVWRSSDGQTWEPQAADPALEFVTPFATAALGSDVYVVGDLSACAQSVDDSCTDVPEAGTVIVRVPPSGPAERLALPEDLQQGLVDSMVALGTRLAVHGALDDANETVRLWLTSDGSSWSGTSDLSGIDPIATVGTLPNGKIVAFGSVYDDAIEDIQVVAGVSDDGQHFSRVSAPDIPGTYVSSVAQGANASVAVGDQSTDQTNSGIAMFSSDGSSWELGAATDSTFDDGFPVKADPLPTGFVATGYSPEQQDYSVQWLRVWLSSDGRTWRLVGQATRPYTQFESSAVGPQGLVLFAADQPNLDIDSGGDSTPVAWFVPASDLNP